MFIAVHRWGQTPRSCSWALGPGSAVSGRTTEGSSSLSLGTPLMQPCNTAEGPCQSLTRSAGSALPCWTRNFTTAGRGTNFRAEFHTSSHHLTVGKLLSSHTQRLRFAFSVTHPIAIPQPWAGPARKETGPGLPPASTGWRRASPPAPGHHSCRCPCPATCSPRLRPACGACPDTTSCTWTDRPC